MKGAPEVRQASGEDVHPLVGEPAGRFSRGGFGFALAAGFSTLSWSREITRLETCICGRAGSW
jgi:hypothetical protein